MKHRLLAGTSVGGPAITQRSPLEMGDERGIRVTLAQPGDELEVGRFDGAFDHAIFPDETRRFLAAFARA